MTAREQTPYLRRFLRYALDYKPLLAIAVVMGLAKFGVNYTFPWLIGSAIDYVIEPVEGASRAPGDRTRWLWTLIALGVLFSLIHGVATFGRGFYTAKLGNRIIADLRQDLFDHLHRLSLHFYSKERTGSIISRLITDIQTASNIVNRGVVSLAMDCFSIVLGLALLMSISWELTLACLTIMPLYAITFRRLNPRVKRASARVQSQLSKISGNVQERLAGIAVVKTYAAEGRESENFKVDTEEHYDRVLTQTGLSQSVNAISEGLVHLGQTIVIGLGGYLALRGNLTGGEVVKFMGWLALTYLPVRRFAEINVVFQTSLAAIERVFQVFDITPRIAEKPDPVTVSPPTGEVRFERVWFDYHDDSDESRMSLEEHSPAAALRDLNVKPELAALDADARRWVLEDIDLVVRPGERIALVGPSGSGKTTLVSLLPRLYDASQGRILIDGVDVRDYRVRTLRKAIGIVQQDSFLFTGSIRDNLTYGRRKASDEEVVAAAQAANAHDFITALPDGYDTQLGERGVNLSGGQRQRLSIARAIIKDPRILILDEATSALDSESERLVQQALERLMDQRTSFIIAHRLSTVRHADRIIVMQHGRIVEIGCHEELLGQNGLYASLCQQQFGLAMSGA